MSKFILFPILHLLLLSQAFAKCEEFLLRDQLKPIEIDEHTKFNVLRNYKNQYSKKANESKAIKTFDVNGLYLSKFKSGRKDVILVYRKTARLVAVIEDKKVIYCGAYPRNGYY